MSALMYSKSREYQQQLTPTCAFFITRPFRSQVRDGASMVPHSEALAASDSEPGMSPIADQSIYCFDVSLEIKYDVF